MDELTNMRRRAYQSQQRQGGGHSLSVPGTMGGAKNTRTIFGPPLQKPTPQKLPPMVRPNFNVQKPVQAAPTPRTQLPGSRAPVPGRLPGIQARGPAPQAKPVLSRQSLGSAPIRQSPVQSGTPEKKRTIQDIYSLPVKVQPVPPQLRAAFDRTRQQAGLVKPQQVQPAGPKYDFYVDEYTADTGSTASAVAPSLQPRQTAPRTKPPAQRPQLLHSPQVKQQVQQPQQQVQQARQQTPTQFRSTIQAPADPPRPVYTENSDEAWQNRMQSMKLFSELVSAPVSILVNRMASDPGSFPTPADLQRDYPLPPEDKKAAEPSLKPLNSAQVPEKMPQNKADLNNVMNQMVGINEEGNLQKVYSDLSVSISDIVSELTAMVKDGDLFTDRSGILRLAQHINQICKDGMDMKPYLENMRGSSFVFGVLDRVKSFSGRVATMLQSGERMDRMRAQRHSSKENIRAMREQRLTNSEDERRNGMGHIAMPSTYMMARLNKKGEAVEGSDTKLRMRHEFSGNRDSTGRAHRLDEELIQMRRAQSRALAENSIRGERAIRSEMELSSAENYDLTRELAEANRKRERSGLWDILVKDGTAVAKSILSLSPGGNPLMSGVVDSLTQGGTWIKRKLSAAIQGYRNIGGYNADLNKSDKMKAQRRHNLAHIMYRQLHSLVKDNLLTSKMPEGKDVKEWAEYSDKLGRFSEMGERLDATGRAERIADTKDGRSMLDEIRKGFYQNAD